MLSGIFGLISIYSNGSNGLNGFKTGQLVQNIEKTRLQVSKNLNAPLKHSYFSITEMKTNTILNVDKK